MLLGWCAGISRSSSNPIRVFQGFDATFQWTLSKNLTSRPDFKGLVFGLWKNGYLATYITTVTRKEEIIPNPDLKVEAPQLDGRVQWKGDLSKSLAAFQISDVSLQDQMDYGLLLNFGPFRNSPSDSVRLEVKGKRSTYLGARSSWFNISDIIQLVVHVAAISRVSKGGSMDPWSPKIFAVEPEAQILNFYLETEQKYFCLN